MAHTQLDTGTNEQSEQSKWSANIGGREINEQRGTQNRYTNGSDSIPRASSSSSSSLGSLLRSSTCTFASDFASTSVSAYSQACIRVGDSYQATLPAACLPSASAASPSAHSTSGTIASAFVRPTEKREGVAIANGDVDIEEEEWKQLQCMWSGSRVKSNKTLDSYLTFVCTLFSKSPIHYSEERALLFLHYCDYHFATAQRLLKPAIHDGASATAYAGLSAADSDSTTSSSSAAAAAAAAASLDYYYADDFCTVCLDGGSLMLCDAPGCSKVYHAACIKLDSVPSGTWKCPYHTCKVCDTPIAFRKENDKAAANPSPFASTSSSTAPIYAPSAPHSCASCPTSYCPRHVPPSLSARLSSLALVDFFCPTCLSSIETLASSRPHQWRVGRHYAQRMQTVLKREGQQITRIPIVQGKELSLVELYRAVKERGGIEEVITRTGWVDIKRQLKLYVNTSSNSIDSVRDQIISLNNRLKRIYLNALYCFEKQYFPSFHPVLSSHCSIPSVDAVSEAEIQSVIASATSSTNRKARNAENNQCTGAAMYDGDDDVETFVMSFDELEATTGGGGGGGSTKPNGTKSTAAENKAKAKSKPVAKAQLTGSSHSRVANGYHSSSSTASSAFASTTAVKRGRGRPAREKVNNSPPPLLPAPSSASASALSSALSSSASSPSTSLPNSNESVKGDELIHLPAVKRIAFKVGGSGNTTEASDQSGGSCRESAASPLGEHKYSNDSTSNTSAADETLRAPHTDALTVTNSTSAFSPLLSCAPSSSSSSSSSFPLPSSFSSAASPAASPGASPPFLLPRTHPIAADEGTDHTDTSMSNSKRRRIDINQTDG